MDNQLNTARSKSDDIGRLDNTTLGQLTHLSDMDDYEIVDGEPDISGWDVRASNGDKIGEVEDLLVDSATLRVRYIEVELNKDLVPDNDRRHALIPIGAARLNSEKDDVVINLGSERLLTLPPYVRGTLSREYEQSIVDGFAPASVHVVSTNTERDFYDGEQFDDRRLLEGRRQPAHRDSAYLRRPGT